MKTTSSLVLSSSPERSGRYGSHDRRLSLAALWLFALCLITSTKSHLLPGGHNYLTLCTDPIETKHTVILDVVGNLTSASAAELQTIGGQFVGIYGGRALVGCISGGGSYALALLDVTVLSETQLSLLMTEVCNGCTTDSLFSGETVPSAPSGCPFCDPPSLTTVLMFVDGSIGELNRFGAIPSITDVTAITQVFVSPSPVAPAPVTPSPVTPAPIVPLPSVSPTVGTPYPTPAPIPPITIDEAFPFTADAALFGSNFGIVGESYPIYTFCVTCASQGPYTPRPSGVGKQYVGNRNGDNLRFIMVLDEILTTDVQNNPTIFTENVMSRVTANDVTADFVTATMIGATQVSVQVNGFTISYLSGTQVIRQFLIISDPSTSSGGRQ